MGEDLGNHRRIFDGSPSTRLRTGDDLQAAGAVGAVFNVDVEDPFEQPGPTDARRRALRVSVLAWGLGGTLWRSGLMQFVVRGLNKVKAVALWYALAHNLMRAVTLAAQA